jgi:hypothetical protein
MSRKPYRFLLSVRTARPPQPPPDRVTLIALREHKILCVGVESLMTTPGCVKIP